MAALAATALAAGGNTISSLVSTGAGLFQSGQQINAAYTLQSRDQSFQESMRDYQVKAFTDAGLPKFAAFSSGSSIPQNKFSLGGSNYQTGGVVGQTHFGSSPFAQYNAQSAPLWFTSETKGKNMPSGASRPGIGYNNVPPPPQSSLPRGTEMLNFNQRPGYTELSNMSNIGPNGGISSYFSRLNGVSSNIEALPYNASTARSSTDPQRGRGPTFVGPQLSFRN